ncbi:MAG TPA: Uma2 family endonuclease [Kofleriaceae bacterium]|jgi:Uma2 family endonuclease|nr:Uma2 family endonuclease [Kofleriaceae bacterium]
MLDSGAVSFEPELVRPLKRSEYDQMVALGLFDDERVELIRGVLVKMSPQRAPHASTVQKLYQLLTTRLQNRFTVRSQLPIALSDDTESESDIAVVPLGDYEAEYPGTALLIIEVADTTLKKDRTKATVYAAGGVGEYWIVNLVARTVEVYASPSGSRYDEVRTLCTGEVLQPTALPDVTIAVAEILPKA